MRGRPTYGTFDNTLGRCWSHEKEWMGDGDSVEDQALASVMTASRLASQALIARGAAFRASCFAITRVELRADTLSSFPLSS